MSRVFVVQDSDHNLLAAKEYGEIYVMLSYRDVEKGSKFVYEKLKIELRDIESTDFLLCIGDPMAIGLAVHLALYWTEGKVQLLKWDRKHYYYKKEELSIP